MESRREGAPSSLVDGPRHPSVQSSLSCRHPPHRGLRGAVAAHGLPAQGQSYHGVSSPRHSAHLLPRAAPATASHHPLSGAALSAHRVTPKLPVVAAGMRMGL